MIENLYADYLAEIDFVKFKSADVIARGEYYFVDITYNGKDKQTKFRFDNAVDANSFLDIVNKTFYVGSKLIYSFIYGVTVGAALMLLIGYLA